jgi:hypothetical protein
MNGELMAITGKMSREFQIFAWSQHSRFVVRGIGEGCPREFSSLFEAARHARTQPECERGLVLVCSYCRRVSGNQSYWSQIEAYLREDSDLKLSHVVCQDCFERQAKELGFSPPTAADLQAKLKAG